MEQIPLTEYEKSLVARTVQKAETKTSGEITIALIRESSNYSFYELRASLAGVLILYMVQLALFEKIALFVSTFTWTAAPWHTMLFIGSVSFLAGGLFFFISNHPAIDRMIIPREIMNRKVRQRALQHFTESGVYATSKGTGILIFVSLLERRVELIADKGINARIEESRWQSIVKALSREIGSGNLAEGLVQAIRECGSLLAEFFPISPDDIDELSNDLVILED